MASTSQFPQLVPARVRGALERIEAGLWFDPRPVRLEQTAVTPRPVSWQEARRAPRKLRVAPFHWGRLFHSTWFRATWKAGREEPRRWLRWRDQAEATVYVGGRAHYGFDVAHRCAPLPQGVNEAWIDAVCCQSAIWHPAATGLDSQGSRFEGADVVARDEEAWVAYHDLLVLHEVSMHTLARVDPEAAASVERPGRRAPLPAAPAFLRQLLRQLDEAIDAYDRNGLGALRRALKKVYGSLQSAPGGLEATMIGHAHIDLVWLWPEHVGETKAIHTFATVDRLMETYPEFRFTFSQPASYAAVERRNPELMRRVARRIRSGRWEATGAAWVEADTLLPCGEALLRGFQLGQADFERRTGRPSRVLWLPDAFGYAACLPQVLRLAGATAFFTNKITWSRLQGFPHSSFVWRGADGTEVLAHVSHEARQFYNGQATVRELVDGAESYRQADVHDGFLVPTGFGDGGGGPTEEMCERVRRMANLASVPRAQWGGVEAYFDSLAPVRAKLPVWDGEMYLEYHRGTYTTHGRLKTRFRRAENALRLHEAARCAAGEGSIGDEPWRRLVMAQFHDAIPGTSINEVCSDLEEELHVLAEEQGDAASAILQRARSPEERLFNPLPVPVDVVRGDTDGLRRVWVPPLSGVAVREGQSSPVASVRVGEHSLDNGIVRAEFDRKGELKALRVRGVSAALSEPGAQLWLYPDKPHAFDAWDLDRHVLDLGSLVQGNVRWERSGDGTACGEFACERRIGEASRVRVTYRLEAGAAVLRIRYDVDWRDPQTLLKAVFPTRYRGRMARFGAPFGSVLRSQYRGRPEDEAQWEVPASRWALVADDGEREGLMIVSEARYGFGCRSGVLDVSLLRSALVTGESRKFQRSLPPALRDHRGPRFSDLGPQTIELAVGLFAASGPREEMPAMLAETLFSPPLAYRGDGFCAGLNGFAGGETLVPVWAKPLSAGRWLLRCHETMGRRGTTTLQLTSGWRVRRAGMGEASAGRNVRTVQFGPYEIVSLIVERG